MMMAHPVDPSATAMDGAPDGAAHKHSSVCETLTHPVHGLKEKLKHSHLHDVKVGLMHKKAQIGKFANLVGTCNSVHATAVTDGVPVQPWPST